MNKMIITPNILGELQNYIEKLFTSLDENLVTKLNPKINLITRNNNTENWKTFSPPNTEEECLTFDKGESESFSNQYITRIIDDAEPGKCFLDNGKIILSSSFQYKEEQDLIYNIYIVLQIKENEHFTFTNDKADNLPTFINVLIFKKFFRIAKQFIIADINESPISLFYDYPLKQILQSATENFIFWNIISLRYEISDDLNNISALRYEGEECFGRLVSVSNLKKEDNIEMIIEFETPIIISEHRKIRKILNLSNTTNFLVLQYNNNSPEYPKINGIGQLKNPNLFSEKDLCVIDFKGHFCWELGHFIKTSDQNKNTKPIIVIKNGQPLLPQERTDKLEFENYCKNIFTSIQQSDMDDLWKILEQAIIQKHGTMLVILEANTAKEEADRLGGQCFKITPKQLNAELIKELTSIDGSLLLSSDGNCHAIGVILDGKATEEGDSSRGARYNSAIRYYKSMKGKHELLIVVISEDGMINFIPQN
jgi:hypothetical protein